MAHQEQHNTVHVHNNGATTAKHVILVLFLLGGLGGLIWAWFKGMFSGKIPGAPRTVTDITGSSGPSIDPTHQQINTNPPPKKTDSNNPPAPNTTITPPPPMPASQNMQNLNP